MATDRLILDGKEVDLGDSVVALSLQANNIMLPDKIQSNFSSTITIPQTKKNRKHLGFADQVNSVTEIPYQILGAQVFKEGIEVVPFGKGVLNNGNFEIDIYSGNLSFFDVLGDKKLKDLSFPEFNHIWNYANVVNNSINTTWQQGFVYDLYDRGKSYNLNAIDWFNLFPSIYVRAVWEQIFKEAGFTYSGFSHPMFDKKLLPTSKLYEFDEDFTKPRSMRMAVGPGYYDHHGPIGDRSDVVKIIPFTFAGEDPYFTSVNYDATDFKYRADTAYLVNITIKAHAFINITIGGVAFELYLFKNGQVIGYVSQDATNANLDNTIELKNYLLKKGDVLYAQVKLRGYTKGHRWGYALFNDGRGNLDEDSFQIEVLKEFPQGGEVRLQDWLPDMSQKDFIKSMVHLFGLTFQTDLYQNNIRINTFTKVLDNIPQAIDISNWVHEPERIRPSYKFGDFAQKNKFIWQPDDTVTEGYNDGEILIKDATLVIDKEIIKLPYAATESRANLLYIPIWKLKTGNSKGEELEYDKLSIKPRLVVQGDNTILFTIVEREIKRDAENKIIKNTIINQSAGNRPLAYYVDGPKPFDLNINEYIIPTFYPTLLAILAQTKVLSAKVKTPAQFIQGFDQARPCWISYFQQYFYINKIENFINSNSLTEWELIRL